uniref:Uncharacterized protein n=1 Tax=Anguilla anguilla TaxID=7936 RepID=A0A0E9XEX2_ANGAN
MQYMILTHQCCQPIRRKENSLRFVKVTCFLVSPTTAAESFHGGTVSLRTCIRVLSFSTLPMG